MDIITTMLGVFDSVSEWFVGALGDVTKLFYAEGNLTFIGALTIASLALSMATWIIATVRSYLSLKAN